MISANRPIINLDLDLLRTFVAVADLNTFAAAAAAVCRTQSAVSQQMQRLEQLVGKELFARHGRNKLKPTNKNFFIFPSIIYERLTPTSFLCLLIHLFNILAR